MAGDQNYWDGWMRRRMSRRAMLRRAGMAGLVLASGSSLLACNQTGTDKPSESTGSTKLKPKRGGTLKVAVFGATQPLQQDPHIYIPSGNDIYLRMVFDYLVNHNDKFEYTPALSLAESWEMLNDTTAQFKLRKGVKFTDGTEWNAETLKWNIERITNPEVKSPRAYIFNSVKEVQYPDNFTAKVTLKEPMASFFGEMAMAGLGMMSPNHVKKYTIKELESRPLGSGPFVASELVPDSHHVYNRNKDFWRKDENGEQLPYVDTVRYQVIPDATVRIANLQTGVIDVDIAPLLKDIASLKEDPNIKVILQEGISVSGMYWNLSRPPFSNINFRRAITHAVNREAIVKIITHGLAKAWTGVVAPAHAWAWDPKRQVPPYDPVKAKQLLDQAVAQGAKTEFTTYFTPTADNKAMAEMIQSDLAKVGIKVNLIPEQSPEYRYWIKPEIDTFISGYSIVPDPWSKVFVAHHSKGAYTPEKLDKGAGWDTPEGYFAKIDPLIDASNKTYDPKKRAELLNKVSDVLNDEVGFGGLFYRTLAMAVSKKVEGATWGGDGKGRFDRAWINA